MVFLALFLLIQGQKYLFELNNYSTTFECHYNKPTEPELDGREYNVAQMLLLQKNLS